MKEIINEQGTTTIKKGRKYYHIDDCDIPGSIHTDRTAELDKAFQEKNFSAFFPTIKKGIERISRRVHQSIDRYIPSEKRQAGYTARISHGADRGFTRKQATSCIVFEKNGNGIPVNASLFFHNIEKQRMFLFSYDQGYQECLERYPKIYN